jgi:FkbM family methyltransferase
LLYAGLVRAAIVRRRPLGQRVWDRLWSASLARFSGPVGCVLYGSPSVVNFGYASPAFSRQYPMYNLPLVSLVAESASRLGRPASLVDVGAAVGDTILLVRQRCPSALGPVLALDGDPEFFGYLEHNLADVANVWCRKVLLAADEGYASSLVRTHSGTASPQGLVQSPAMRLDDVLDDWGQPVDVLKVDTDGFDGEVLAGARALLGSRQTAVIFEWHPVLCLRTGKDSLRAFEELQAAGYRDLRWFSRHGVPVEVMAKIDLAALAIRSAELCGRDDDEHYDVVAVPPSWAVDEH